MSEQLPLDLDAADETVGRYLAQLPDANPCPRCGRRRVTDWLGVPIHTDTVRQSCTADRTL